MQHVNVERMTAWVRELTKLGHSVTVVCKWLDDVPSKRLLREEFGGGLEVFRMETSDGPNGIQAAMFRLERRIRGRLIRLWRDPRSYWWKDPALKKQLLRIIDRQEPHVLISSSPSDDVHAIAKWVKRKSARATRPVTWVADYRDPFIVDPRSQRDAPLSKFFRVRKKYEAETILGCDLNVTAIPSHARYLRMKFPKAKSILITNGFSHDLWPSRHEYKIRHDPIKKDDTKVIFSAGTIGVDELNRLATAVAMLSEGEQKYVIHYAGKKVACDKENVKYLGYLKKADVYDEMFKADILLSALSNERRKSSKGLSSKILEYLAAGRYLILVNPTCQDQLFVKNISHAFILKSPSVESFLRCIRELRFSVKERECAEEWAEEYRKSFSRERQVQDLLLAVSDC